MRRWGPAAVLLLLSAFVAPAARAQVAFSAAIESDDRLRGVSLTDGQPIASVSVSLDRPSGFFGGVTAKAVATSHSGLRPEGYVAYLGYARTLAPSLSWDLGVTNSEVLVYRERRYTANYTELRTGVSLKNVAAHIYYSPRYLNDAPTLYVDLAGALHPVRNWRLFGHLGLLTGLSEVGHYEGERVRLDLRAGIAREFGRGEIRAEWIAATPAPYFPPYTRQHRNALVLGATYFF